MIRRLLVALLFGLAAGPARADDAAVLRVGVIKFKTRGAATGGDIASDLFSATLYRNFPGLTVVERTEIEEAVFKGRTRKELDGTEQGTAALLQRTLDLDTLAGGSVIALNPDGRGGGTLMMSARLVKLSSGEVLWADTKTVKLKAPLFGSPDSDEVVAAKLLELGVFQLVQDLGKRLPEDALKPVKRSRKERGSGECAPPAFYQSLARDRDWYYGVGKDADTDKARDAAVLNLAKQVTGFVGKWRDASAVLAPGRDRGEIADEVENLLPRSTLLAGWEQDDHQRCKGVSYVLVRIDKERVRKFIASDADFKTALREALAARRRPAEHDLEGRVDLLELRSARRVEVQEAIEMDRRPGDYSDPADDLLKPLVARETAAAVKAHLKSGGVTDAEARADVAGAESVFSELNGSKPTGFDRTADASDVVNARRKLDAGTLTMDDVVRARAYFRGRSMAEDDRAFLDAVIYTRRMKPEAAGDGYKKMRELAFPLAWSAALNRNDWHGFFKYSKDYLRMYPDGIYAAAARKNRENAAKVLMQGSGAVVAAAM